MKKPVSRFFAAVEPFLIDDQVYSFVAGVTVGLRPSRVGDSVYVMKIRSIDRGECKASQTLDQICEIADSNLVVLFLEVEESDGLTAKQLADWYWRRGFRGKSDEMVREPSAAD